MILNLYHLHNSRSQRIIWLFEELQLQYSLIDSQTANESQLPPHVLPIKFPTVMINHGGQDLYMNESSSICELIANHHQTLLPIHNDFESQCQWAFWKNYCDSSFMPNLALKQIFGQILQKTPLPFKPVSWCFKSGFNSAYLNRAISGQLEMLNEHFSSNKFVIGDTFTYVDILMHLPLFACHECIEAFEIKYPFIDKYLQELQSRPAYISACDVGSWSNDEFKRYWSSAW